MILAVLLYFDSSMTIYIANYEIFTNTKFFLLILIIIFLIGFFSNYIINAVFSIFKRKNAINNSKNDKYLDNVYNSILFGVSGDIKKANNYLAEARKNGYNKLTDLISAMFNNDKKIGDGLFNYNVKLSEALKNKDNINILYYCSRILKLQKNNKYCKELVYNVTKNKQNWMECLTLMRKGYYKKNYNELKLLYKNIAKDFYNKNDYKNAFKYANLLFKYNDEEDNKILINSLKIINPKKLDKYIEKVWKRTPYKEIGDLYCAKNYKKAKKLLRINSKNPASIIYCANVLLDSGAKINVKLLDILRDNNSKEARDLFLKIKNASDF